MSASRRTDHVPTETLERVADTMFALATPSRLRILMALREGPLTVSAIVAAVGMEQSAVSHQLRVLREHSVLTMRRIGRTREYALRDEHVRLLVDEALAHVLLLEHPKDAAASAERERTASSER